MNRNRDHAEMAIRLASMFASEAENGPADEIARNERDRDHWLAEWIMDVAEDAGIRPRPAPALLDVKRGATGGGSSHYSDGLPYDPDASELMHCRTVADAPGVAFRVRNYDPHGEDEEGL